MPVGTAGRGGCGINQAKMDYYEFEYCIIGTGNSPEYGEYRQDMQGNGGGPSSDRTFGLFH